MKARLEISAGGVIYRRRADGIRVCLIATNDRTTWQLPKGIVEPGEEPEVAAQREVAEETGLQGALVRKLERIEYWYVWRHGSEPERVHKFVDFYLFRYVRGSAKDHDDEVDEARWFALDEAQKRLSFDGERGVLQLAAEALVAAD